MMKSRKTRKWYKKVTAMLLTAALLSQSCISLTAADADIPQASESLQEEAAVAKAAAESEAAAKAAAEAEAAAKAAAEA
ncbi:MAG: hypothetical protein Q4B01_08780, partial [Eubacteriales bacterium]|nr:hypothetical protein [Eubacteriales bacterium]